MICSQSLLGVKKPFLCSSHNAKHNHFRATEKVCKLSRNLQCLHPALWSSGFSKPPFPFLKVSFPLLIFPVSTQQKHYSLSNLSQAPRAQTSGGVFCSMKQFVLPFSSTNIYILIFSKTELQTLPVLAQRIYYTHPGAEENGQLLGGTVRDQHIQTQWQGNSFFCGSYLLSSSYRVYSDTPQRESHCSSRGRKKMSKTTI